MLRRLYRLSDLGLEFYTGFRDGAVVAGLGATQQPAEVRVKASGSTLDNVLAGKISANEAATSGDVRLAMEQQRIRGDLIRLYSAAREEAGGLDTATLARVGLPPSPAAAVKAPDTCQDPREDMVRTVQELYAVQASSLRQACNLTQAVERTSQLILGCYAVGKRPPTLPKDVVRAVQELGDTMA